jgi:hypothetical protein
MKYTLLLIAVVFLCGCGNRNSRQSKDAIDEETSSVADSVSMKTMAPHTETNSIYYWKTFYELNDSELSFLKEHDVKRIYIRYFDVALDNNWLGDQLSAIPIATTVFKQTPTETMEVVPTVYITLDALRSMKGNETDYANKIITRIAAMTKHHNIPNVKEVQFDCDWTQTTQESYFRLCSVASYLLHKSGISLSATIRLHQIKDPAPPVDRGVLMLYNTGSLFNAMTENSILNYKDVEPYLRSSVKYDMHLDFAYPTFSWGVWFRDGEFRAIIRKTDFSDKTLYGLQRNGTYRVVKDHYVESQELLSGDVIRLENSNYDEIMKVKKLAESRLGKDKYSCILYHLNSENLSKYTPYEIENIYRAN